jgi:hypothetical protein
MGLTASGVRQRYNLNLSQNSADSSEGVDLRPFTCWIVGSSRTISTQSINQHDECDLRNIAEERLVLLRV